jgi:hypothetical protein
MSQSISLRVISGTDDDGATHWRARFAVIDRALRREGLPGFQEPETGPLPKVGNASMPYDWIWRLRRAVAYAIEDQTKLPDFKPAKTAAEEDILSNATSDMSSHLISTWTTDTIFVPVDFQFPIPLSEDGSIEGYVSSTHGLLAELHLVAPLLGIQFAPDGSLSRDEVSRIMAERGAGPKGPERAAWLVLFALGRAGIESRTALVFH